MRVVNVFRVVTVVAMVVSLVAGFLRPELFGVLREVLLWLIPLWIGVLFLVQAAAAPSVTGEPAFQVWWDRIRGRGWTCRRCGAKHAGDVPYCPECGEMRGAGKADGGPWTCEVCESENVPEAAACARCSVPRPGGG